jgi:hypothetical protein
LPPSQKPPKNPNVANATCHSLSFGSGKFDLVLDLSIIDPVPFRDVNLVFGEYYLVLRPDELLALAFWR